MDDYVGIPFRAEGRDRAGCDCYGLLRLVYREHLGVELPEYTGYVDPQSDLAAALIQAGLSDWRPVERPRPYDGVLIRVDGAPHHMGLVVRPGWMLHTSAGKDACIESYLRPHWRGRIEGFYRYGR